MVILAGGLTPAWQQTLVFETFAPGEVNRAQQAAWCASGKVLNVGCLAHQLGSPSHTVSFAGGVTGQALRADFATLGVPTTWVETAAPTRVCTTILDRQHHVTTELVENAAPVSAEELTAYLQAWRTQAARAKVMVLSGSTPAGTPVDFLASLAAASAVPLVLDFRGEELRRCLALKPWVVKPNHAELAATVGHPLIDEADIWEAMAELRSAGAEHVVVTDGGNPVWTLGPEGRAQFTPPKVAVVNPIGCGDCFATGLAYGRLQGDSWDQTVTTALAIAAENARHLLPARFPWPVTARVDF